MMLTFHVSMLASGSKGNATLVSSASQRFLVDCGLSCRELERRLKLLGLRAAQLDAVFITHEHRDHIKGLLSFTKNYRVPVYASAKTWQSIVCQLGLSRSDSCRIFQGPLAFGSIVVDHFPIPHDAIDPHGYTFSAANGAKCTYLTDTGFVSPAVQAAAANSEVLILEANHDPEMLKNGRYPPRLKQRILSTRGHLSNVSAAELLAQLEPKPRLVFLAHLSAENNRPELALKTVCERLQKAGLAPEATPRILVAKQEEIVDPNPLPLERECLF